jgi:DNA-binding Lrp family transcriptional regulator
MLSELEKKVIAEIQGDIAISERPYLEIAQRIGIDEDTLLKVIKDLSEKEIIRRFGATLRHQQSGFTANAMTAWIVEENRIDEVGEIMAASPRVSHCYRRNPSEKWPYNLYTMIHAADEDSCRAIARELSEKTSVDAYTILFSRKELKKTSMAYFASDDEC